MCESENGTSALLVSGILLHAITFAFSSRDRDFPTEIGVLVWSRLGLDRLKLFHSSPIEKSIEFEFIIPTAFTTFERTIEHAIHNKTNIIQMFSSYIYAATAYLNGGLADAMGKPPSNDERTSRNSDAHFLPTVLAPIKLAGARRERKHNFGDAEPKDEDFEMAEHGFNTWYFEDEETGELIPSWKWPEMVSRYRDS